VLAMPDFSTVSGWQPSYAIAATASGTWSVILDGSNVAGPRCTDGRTTVSITKNGAF